MARLALRELCGYRAGDKGDIANVAIFADDDETYALIVREVTADRVKSHFGAMVRGRVERYEAPNVRALNFVMHGALGGGGPRSPSLSPRRRATRTPCAPRRPTPRATRATTCTCRWRARPEPQ